ncbi:inner centromere protein-like isoform X2 [Stegostoma tigrinum]|uniref:inner centromere protein-like isoform X2 n=1 Tax=Stegostoma tigrinum TaxID=3053191 RepID=UPI00202B4BC7|nr:inner centromere protein-like isoform X2 [Stegostoma tigrinum]
MTSKTAIILVDTDNMLKFFDEKLNALIEDFKGNGTWLKEIQEEAKKMFICNFNEEPELMPKTPSERKRLRRRSSVIWDSNKRFSRSRKSLRRSSVQWPKLFNRIFVENNGDCISRTEHYSPVPLTRSASRAAATVAKLETDKHNLVPVNGRVPLVELSLNGSKTAEFQKSHMVNLAQSLLSSEDVNLLQKTVETKKPPGETILESAVNLSSPNHEAMRLKINVVATKENVVTGETSLTNWQLGNMPLADGGSVSGEDDSKLDHNYNRRSVRKSKSSRRSSCFRLMHKYSLNVQRATMVQESGRKSLRKSIVWRKNTPESSASSYHNVIQKLKKNTEEECVEVSEPKQNQPVTMTPEKQGLKCTRNDAKVAKGNLEENESGLQACGNSPRFQGKDSSNSDELNSDNRRLRSKNSCKRCIENTHNSKLHSNCDNSVPRKSPSSPCPTSKEKEKIRLKNQEQEERIQRVEEEKKLQLEEFKKKQNLRLRYVAVLGKEFPKQEEGKKRKIERNNSQIDEQNEKEGERQELLQQEEELERQRKMAEARKLKEQRQTELELDALHELQQTADRQWERKREQEHFEAEKECEHVEKEKAVQLQQKLEFPTAEDAVLLALPKGWLCEAAQQKESKLRSPVLESYTMTPNGYSKIKLSEVNLETYGMDLQSDDSTDDEGVPRKPIPTWANGGQLQQALIKQYYHPLDADKFFGIIQSPNLENIFGKSKPRYLKRTSSAVWHSPPVSNSVKNVPCGVLKH